MGRCHCRPCDIAHELLTAHGTPKKAKWAYTNFIETILGGLFKGGRGEVKTESRPPRMTWVKYQKGQTIHSGGQVLRSFPAHLCVRLWHRKGKHKRNSLIIKTSSG